MDDLDQRLRACAAAPAGEFDADDVARRAARLRRRRRLASGLGVALVLAVVALGTVTVWDGGDTEVALDGGGAGEPQTFARPEAGEVVAITAPDGEPAFLVGREDGATAFRAVEPLASGMRELVVWCEPAQTFVTPFALSEWSMDGHYLGGPAPGDLVSYQTDLRDGQVVVGEARARPDRTPDATAPPGDWLEACRADRGSAASPTADTVRSLPIDPDVTVSHAHPEQGDWPPVEQALAAADGPDTLDVRLAVTGTADEPFQACADPSGEPPQCSEDAPIVDGLDEVDDELAAVSWQGYARVTTDGAAITGFDLWVSVTELHSLPEGGADRPRDLALDQARRQLGPEDHVSVDGDHITVPAVGLSYGNPPAQPVPAGTYQLTLENHGRLDHTLVNDDLDVDLATSSQPGQLTDTTTVELEPGRYTLYCRVPGHRDAGMEVDVVVDEATP